MWTDFRKRVTDCGRNRHFYKVPEVSLLTVDHRLPFLKEKCSGYKIDIHTSMRTQIHFATAVPLPHLCWRLPLPQLCQWKGPCERSLPCFRKSNVGGIILLLRMYMRQYSPCRSNRADAVEWWADKWVSAGDGELTAPRELWAESVLSSGGIARARREHLPRAEGRYGSPWCRRWLWAPCTVGSILTSQQ